MFTLHSRIPFLRTMAQIIEYIKFIIRKSTLLYLETIEGVWIFKHFGETWRGVVWNSTRICEQLCWSRLLSTQTSGSLTSDKSHLEQRHVDMFSNQAAGIFLGLRDAGLAP